MKKSLLLIITLMNVNSDALDITDSNIMLARKIGILVYTSCIIPSAPSATCETIYSKYKIALTNVAAPTPLGISQEQFHYPSMYDVCKYDASHFVFDNPATQPYCPAL